MGFEALKQHLEKLKHRFSEHLSQSLTGHGTDPKADTGIEKDTKTPQQPERKAHQSCISSSSKRVVQP